MEPRTLQAFLNEFAELQKLAGRGIGELLAGKAIRRGLDPSKIPSITQAANIAGFNRPRAAEVAKNVKGFLSQAHA